MPKKILSLGTMTRHGKVSAVIYRGIDQERYYMMIDKKGGVALMPESEVEVEEL